MYRFFFGVLAVLLRWFTVGSERVLRVGAKRGFTAGVGRGTRNPFVSGEFRAAGGCGGCARAAGMGGCVLFVVERLSRIF